MTMAQLRERREKLNLKKAKELEVKLRLKEKVKREVEK